MAYPGVTTRKTPERNNKEGRCHELAVAQQVLSGSNFIYLLHLPAFGILLLLTHNLTTVYRFVLFYCCSRGPAWPRGRTLNLYSGGPEFKSPPCHKMNLSPVVPNFNSSTLCK